MKDNRTLYRGLRTLFWVEIGGIIGSFLVVLVTVAAVAASVMHANDFYNHLQQGNSFSLNLELTAMLPVIVWSCALTLAMAAIHLWLGRAEGRYTASGVLLLLTAILSTAISCGEVGYWFYLSPESVSLLSLPLAGIGIAYFCVEIGAHRHALAGVDDKLAKRWRVLRILTLVAIPAVVLIVLLILVAALTESVALLFAAIPLLFLIPGSMITLNVLRYVYLFKTGSRFRQNEIPLAIEGENHEE